MLLCCGYELCCQSRLLCLVALGVEAAEVLVAAQGMRIIYGDGAHGHIYRACYRGCGRAIDSWYR